MRPEWTRADSANIAATIVLLMVNRVVDGGEKIAQLYWPGDGRSTPKSVHDINASTHLEPHLNREGEIRAKDFIEIEEYLFYGQSVVDGACKMFSKLLARQAL
jgi:hypothetical protein